MARMPGATWRGPTVNQGGTLDSPDIVTVHIAAGTFEGTISWQRNPDADVSSHFIVARDGRLAQMVDTSVRAWTQKAGNSRCISIENEGYLPDPLTAAQVETNARILAWCHLQHGIPLQVTNDPDRPGLGHHSMGAENGLDWGHSACPGPAIKAQKAEIVRQAIEIVGGSMDLSRNDRRKPEIVGDRGPGTQLDDVWGHEQHGKSPYDGALSDRTKRLVRIEENTAKLLARPPVQPAPVDPAVIADAVAAGVKAALADPDTLVALARAVADEDHRRSAA